MKCPETKFQVTPLEACQDPHFFVRLLMDTASLKGTMHTTRRSKVKWAAPGPHGVILLLTQRRVFQWREFHLMLPIGFL